MLNRSNIIDYHAREIYKAILCRDWSRVREERLFAHKTLTDVEYQKLQQAIRYLAPNKSISDTFKFNRVVL